jgi:hypothetical protein
VVVLVGGVIVAGKTTVLVSVSPVRRPGIEKDGRASGSHDRILNATPDKFHRKCNSDRGRAIIDNKPRRLGYGLAYELWYSLVPSLMAPSIRCIPTEPAALRV